MFDSSLDSIAGHKSNLKATETTIQPNFHTRSNKFCNAPVARAGLHNLSPSPWANLWTKLGLR